jgi:hypothetical protein
MNHAAVCYAKRITMDNLAGEFYRHLMIWQWQACNHADAVSKANANHCQSKRCATENLSNWI